jgi:MtN3 and saliva related transmembrane protein
MNLNPEIIGIFAGIFTTICFIPQSIAVIKSENTKSISVLMYSLFSMGVLLWLIYGIYINSLPIVIANSITLPLSLIILFKKLQNIVRKID